jgi:stage V sporulation protein G
MQVTEARIYPTDEDIVRAYVTIAFDNWLMIRQIKVIRSTTGHFVSMPAKKQRDGTHRQLAYLANAQTRRMIQ